MRLVVGTGGYISVANPMPVDIVGADVTVNVTTLSGLDIVDRANRILGRVGVDVLTLPYALASDAGLESVWTRLGDGSVHVVVDSMPAGAAAITDTELRASPVAVSGTFWQSTQPVSIASSVPVTGTFWQATQPVSAAALPLPSGAATDAGLAAIFARQADGSQHVAVDNFPSSVAVTGAFYPATQPVSIASMPTTPVTGTFWQATQPVSGPLTDAQLRAVAVPVSGTFWQATQPVSIASMPSTPVTGTFWQATQPVSIAASVAVTGTFYQATQPVSIASMPSTPVTGTFWQATQPVSAAALPLPSGASTEATLALIKAKTDNLDVALSTRAVTGLTDTQLRATPVPVSGTFYQATQPVSIASMPSTPVTGTFWQATQPVSIAASVAVTGTFWQATQPVSGPLTDTQLRATAVPVSGTFWQATQPVSIASMPSTPVTGTFWQATQPVSAAALPLPSGASTETTLSTLNGKVTACNTGAVTVAAITPPTLTKGTQGATGFSTQDLKDAGRVLKTYTVSALATVTTEALISLTPYADIVASSPATTFAVTVTSTTPASMRKRTMPPTFAVPVHRTVTVIFWIRSRLPARCNLALRSSSRRRAQPSTFTSPVTNTEIAPALERVAGVFSCAKTTRRARASAARLQTDGPR